MEGSPNHLNKQTELQELDEHENNPNNNTNERPKKKNCKFMDFIFPSLY